MLRFMNCVDAISRAVNGRAIGRPTSNWFGCSNALLIATLAVLSAGHVSYAAEPKAEVLRILTYDNFKQYSAPGIETAFEEICDCDVQFVAADSSIGILRKLQIDGDDSDIDIVIGLDSNVMELARRTGLFVPHRVDLTDLNLPVEWQDDSFLPVDYGYFAFVYDSERIANPPTSLAEFRNLSSDLKIVIMDPSSSTPGLGLVLWVRDVMQHDAAEWWQDISDNILTVTGEWSAAYNLFLENEADFVLSYTTSPAYHIVYEEANNYKAVEFDEGHYMQIEVAAISKHSHNKQLAFQFMDFVLTPGFQSVIPQTNWMFPVAGNGEGIPDAFDELIEVKSPLFMPAIEVEKVRKSWIAEWKKTLGR